MKIDRELLELAAKAAGYAVDNRASFMTWRDSQRLALLNAKGGHDVWNPLTDDGDALRLAVKLQLAVITLCAGNSEPPIVAVRRQGEIDVEQPYDADPYAATRRAIVRAAAEIGASLKTSETRATA